MSLPQNFVSVSRRPPDIEDYIDMLRRYRSWIIGPMFAGLVISTVVAFLWKDTYQSTAMLRITPQTVSERLVPAEFSMRMESRLNAMTQQILSRTVLEELIKSPSLELYKSDQKEKPMEDIVADMRLHDIHIQMIQAGAVADGRTPITAFSITFTYPDRFKAQQVVQQLVTKFTEQNIQVQRIAAHTTADFLDDEFKTAKLNLAKLDDQITKFKIENQGKLPEEFNSNSAMLQAAQLSSSNLSSELQRVMDMKATYETNLQSAMTQLQYYQDNAEDTVASTSQMSVQNQSLVSTNLQLLQTRQQLAAAQQSLGANNPTVKSLKAQINTLQTEKDRLEKEQAQKDANVQAPDAPFKKVPNKGAQTAILNAKAQIESYKTQIAEANDNIKRIQGLQNKVAQSIAMYEGRIQASPLNERQWAALQSDHALAQAAYNDVVKKQQSAETSQNLEEHQAGEKLEVLDPASDPQQPIEPHRAQWAAIGTGLGLLLGIVLAGGKEMKNTSLKNLKDVRAYTNLPVLSSIPLLENALLVRRKRRLFWLAWTSAFVFGALLVLGSMYYYFSGNSK